MPDVKVHDFLVCMKKIITISCFSLLFAGLFFIMVTQTGCQKQDTNCTCIITVMDSAGINPVANATVRLYVPNAPNGATGSTNIAGKVDFTFALPAIYNIAVSKVLAAGDTLKNPGTAIIQLQIGQTESTTVKVIHYY